MRITVILKVLGVLLTLYSFTMLPPMVLALYFHDGTFFPFFLAFLVILFSGLIAYLPVYSSNVPLRTKDGFIVVFLFWVALSAAGAIPFIFAIHPNLSVVNAFFESVSGITATGATILNGLDFLPPAILYYRQQLQFLGGVGIIILAVAILPILKIGGMQLFQAEFTGPTQDTKLTPRLTQTAKALWLIYVGLTAACIICYWLAGMSTFDAISYAFSTVSTGGFAPHDASFGFYPSPIIRMIAIVFMFLGAVSFPLHFGAIRHGSLKAYLRDPEFKFFLLILLIGFSVIFFEVYKSTQYTATSTSLMDSLFQTISFSTTSGFTTAYYASWPAYVPYVLLLLGTIGGSAGSTSGGIKLTRVLLLLKQSNMEIKKLIHPNGYFSLKFGKNPINWQVMNSVWAFTTMFVAIFIVLTMLLLGAGEDLTTSFSGVASGLANIGPALGKATGDFSALNESSKWVVSFTMILGRLELFTVLVLFSRTFWRS